MLAIILVIPVGFPALWSLNVKTKVKCLLNEQPDGFRLQSVLTLLL